MKGRFSSGNNFSATAHDENVWIDDANVDITKFKVLSERRIFVKIGCGIGTNRLKYII